MTTPLRSPRHARGPRWAGKDKPAPTPQPPTPIRPLMPGGLITLKEAARLLCVHKETVRRMVERDLSLPPRQRRFGEVVYVGPQRQVRLYRSVIEAYVQQGGQA